MQFKYKKISEENTNTIDKGTRKRDYLLTFFYNLRPSYPPNEQGVSSLV